MVTGRSMPKVMLTYRFSALTRNATESTIFGRIHPALTDRDSRRGTHLIEKYGISKTLCPDGRARILDSGGVGLPNGPEACLLAAAQFRTSAKTGGVSTSIAGASRARSGRATATTGDRFETCCGRICGFPVTTCTATGSSCRSDCTGGEGIPGGTLRLPRSEE